MWKSAWVRRFEMALGVAPLVEECGHVDGEVLHHGHVTERLDLQPAAVRDQILTRVRQVQPAGP